jgi:hypothetical protein
MPVDPSKFVEINGTMTMIKDIDDPELQHLFGLGHFRDNRPIVQGDWPYTPETCVFTDPEEGDMWIDDGRTLVCTGCGLDGTE